MTQKRSQKNNPEQKKQISFVLKEEIISKICNGQISKRQASIQYNVSRSAIDYWMLKLTTFEQKNQYMSHKKEIKQLKDKLEEMELRMELAKEIFLEFEKELGAERVKKSTPAELYKLIEEHRKNRLK